MYLIKGRYYEYIAPTVAYIKLYMKINMTLAINEKVTGDFAPEGKLQKLTLQRNLAPPSVLLDDVVTRQF